MYGETSKLKVSGVADKMLEDHQLVAANGQYELYLKPQTLSVLIKDVTTGAVMRSTSPTADSKDGNAAWQSFIQSAVVLDYIKGTNLVPIRVDMIAGKPQIDVAAIENGFKATVSYPDISIGYDLIVTLTDKGFQVEIPESSIVESSEEFKVGDIYVYPFLGYSQPALHKGYMFVPDGSGALIYLEDNNKRFKQPYSEMVFGSDVGINEAYVVSLFNGLQTVKPQEKIQAPIFGMVHTDAQFGFLGIIEKGYTEAWIEAYPNGAITPYDWISSKFVYRQVFNQSTSQTTGTMVVRQEERNHFDVQIAYQFVSGEDADYTGLAKLYRTYLVEKGVLTQQTTNFKVRLDFLGADQENWLMFKKTIPMTTTEQVKTIMTELSQAGVTDMMAVYKGWQKGGIYGGLPISTFKVEKKLGGNKAMKTLLTQMKDLNVSLFLEQDALRINPEVHKTAMRVSIKGYNKRLIVEEVYKKVYDLFNYLLPEETAKNLVASAKSYVKNKVENIMVSGISNTLFSYLSDNKTYDRADTEKTYVDAISQMSGQLNVVLDKPFSNLWQYTDAMMNMPVDTSKYIFTDEEIPFFAIVLKGYMPLYSGYVNFQADQKAFFLKLVEQGVSPSFLLTYENPVKLIDTNSSEIYSSQYSFYKQMIMDYNQELKAINDLTAGAIIEDYTRERNVSIVTYSNGVKVWVNFNDKEMSVDGQTIEPLSYKVGE